MTSARSATRSAATSSPRRTQRSCSSTTSPTAGRGAARWIATSWSKMHVSRVRTIQNLLNPTSPTLHYHQHHLLPLTTNSFPYLTFPSPSTTTTPPQPTYILPIPKYHAAWRPAICSPPPSTAHRPAQERLTMNGGCTHLDRIHDVTPSSWGCQDCLAQGRRDWVHLRVCQECGHGGCCDNSPGGHAPRTSAWPGIRLYGGTNRVRTGIGVTSTGLCLNSRVPRRRRRTRKGSGRTDVDV